MKLFFWQRKETVEEMLQDLGNIEDNALSQEQEILVFKGLSQVEGLQEFLRDTMVKDLRRYFIAQNDKEREMIRGAFLRTEYFRNGIKKSLTGN